MFIASCRMAERLAVRMQRCALGLCALHRTCCSALVLAHLAHSAQHNVKPRHACQVFCWGEQSRGV